MSDVMGFLGIVREVAWVYLVLMFLAATLLYFHDGRRKDAAPKEKETAQERERMTA